MSWLTSCILFFERFWKIFGINNYWFWFEGRGRKKRKFLFAFIIRVKRACPNFRIILIPWSLDKRHIFAFFAEFTKFFKQTKNFFAAQEKKSDSEINYNFTIASEQWTSTYMKICNIFRFKESLLESCQTSVQPRIKVTCN